MATPFSTIYDEFLVSVRDYKLDKLYNLSPTNFNQYLQGFLIKAIPRFTNCVKDIQNIDTIIGQFNDTLDLDEQIIMSNLMVIEWLTREINDVTQFNLHLNDTDFKRYAEANNLKEKNNHRDSLREIVNQDLVLYGLKHTNWQSWASGNYWG